MDRYTQLEKLQELKEKGVLTESEFELEKKKILAKPQTQQPQQRANHKPTTKKSNGAGIAGFVISLVAGFNWYLTLPLGIVGLILSIVGMAKPSKTHKKGLAIAGLIISILVILAGIVFYIQLLTHKDSTGAINRYD